MILDTFLSVEGDMKMKKTRCTPSKISHGKKQNYNMAPVPLPVGLYNVVPVRAPASLQMTATLADAFKATSRETLSKNL